MGLPLGAKVLHISNGKNKNSCSCAHFLASSLLTVKKLQFKQWKRHLSECALSLHYSANSKSKPGVCG